MMRGRQTTIWILSGILLSTGARAVTEDGSSNRYSEIVDRNVFNLHPPPPPVDPSELAKKNVQIPKLTLNGITTILGKKIVFLTLPATKPGTGPETLMLSEGEAQDEVEVKQIDEKAGVVKVVNHAENQTLDFDHDGTKPASPGANPAVPVTIPPVPAAPPPNTMMPPPAPMRPLRTLRSPAWGGSQNSSSMNGSSIGGGTVGQGLSSANTQNQALTPDQQMEMIEAQRYNALQNGDPVLPKILPPTPHSQEIENAFAPPPAPQ